VVYELDLNILKMYFHTKNEVSRLKLWKVKARTDRRKHRRTRRKHYHAALKGGYNYVIATHCLFRIIGWSRLHKCFILLMYFLTVGSRARMAYQTIIPGSEAK